MYEVFNSFLANATWHSGHHLDEERFFQSLARVVRDPDFSANEMGDYIRAKTGTAFDSTIAGLVQKAETVHGYLAAVE